MNSLVIAPQWIGDAVMTEPLLRRLRARGERLAVGALPWVAPVYRAMPQVDEVIEFPFQHGGLQLKARRTHRQADRRPLRHGLCAAQFAQERAAAVPFGHRAARRLSRRSPSRAADASAEESERQAADGGVLFGLERRQGRTRTRSAAAATEAGADRRSACRARVAAARLLCVRARRGIRRCQALAAGPFRAARARTGATGGAARVGQGSRPLRRDRARLPARAAASTWPAARRCSKRSR